MASLREEMAAKIAPLLAPIAGANPAGADPTTDDGFERMKSEIDRLSAVDAREPAWRDVQELSVELLAKRSKDLRVVGWRGAAQLKLAGWSGLAEALVTYDGLARGFWDTMYPEARRARARINSFTWFTDLSAKHLQGLAVSHADADALRTSDEVLRELDQFLADKLGDAYPGLGALRGVVREKLAAVPPPPAAPVAPPPPVVASPSTNGASAEARASATEASPAAAAPTNSEEAEGAAKDAGRALVQAAALLRRGDGLRAWAYRVQRWGAWLGVQDAPPAEGGRTKLRPPPEALQRRLATLRDGQKWLELLQAAEDATGAFLFWLDPHRLVAQALDRLGPTYAAAREVVGREVAAFVSRVPAVSGLSFADGTPFADSATKTWLDEEAARWLGRGGASGAAAAKSAEDEEAEKRFAAAQTLVAEGKVAEGLGTAAVLAQRAPDGRGRFRSQLAVGKMALDASRPDVARPILERLAREAEERRLDEWEPALCASLYSYLLTAIRETMRAKGAPPDLAPKEQSTFEKLCRLDPATALKFNVG